MMPIEAYPLPAIASVKDVFLNAANIKRDSLLNITLVTHLPLSSVIVSMQKCFPFASFLSHRFHQIFHFYLGICTMHAVCLRCFRNSIYLNWVLCAMCILYIHCIAMRRSEINKIDSYHNVSSRMYVIYW